MKRLFYGCLMVLLSFQASSQSKFSKQAVLDDLTTLRNSLQETHIDLFAYTSQKAFEDTYQGLRKQVQKDSLSLLEATKLFQQLISIVNNGHTFIDFPIQSYVAYLQSGGTLFPLELCFEDGKTYVRKDWSTHPQIPVGAEVLSINGKFVDEIACEIYPYISAERPYFKKAKIEFYSFPRYYWQVFGPQDTFEVRVRMDGEVQQFTLQAVSAIENFESKRSEIFQSERKLSLIGPSAYLNPGAFSGDEATFKRFIDSSFAVINKVNSKNLIIDLRNNTGGNDSFSDHMVSYIADEPFRWCESLTIKTSKFLKDYIRKHNDTTNAYFKGLLERKDGEVYEADLPSYAPQPKSKRFKGSVYVLVNRLSISQATVTAAQIQDYGWATIVGEETGEYPTLYASIFQYTLPQTGVMVNVSKGRIVRVNGSKKEEGVQPDLFIRDHLLDEEDEILEGLLEKIH